jgi:hypothetical protein
VRGAPSANAEARRAEAARMRPAGGRGKKLARWRAARPHCTGGVGVAQPPPHQEEGAATPHKKQAGGARHNRSYANPQGAKRLRSNFA